MHYLVQVPKFLLACARVGAPTIAFHKGGEKSFIHLYTPKGPAVICAGA